VIGQHVGDHGNNNNNSDDDDDDDDEDWRVKQFWYLLLKRSVHN